MKYRILVFLIFLLIVSCKTRNNENTLNYMQNVEQIATEQALKNSASTLQPGDQLVILISAKDLDVVKPFNQNYSSGETVQQAQSYGNVPSAATSIVSGPTYIIDSEGNIDYPYLGKLNTYNKTIEDFRDELKTKLRKYIIDPTVNIRLTNFKVSVLGEVNRQGEFVIPNGRGTVLNALSMAGDFTMYGKRDNVLVVRTIDGEITKERINLMDDNFFASPYFHLKQGDVIYVSANKTKEKISKLDPNTGTYISIASVALGLVGIFITLLKK